MKLSLSNFSHTILGRLLFTFSLATIPLAALAIYLTVDEGHEADASAIAQERMATRLVSEDLGLVFQLTRNTMQGLVRKGNDEGICGAIKGSLDQFPHLLNLALVEYRPGKLEATVICSVAGVPRMKQALLKEEEAQLTLRLNQPGDVVVTPVRTSVLTGQPVALMIALVRRESDGTRLALGASINLNWLNKRVNAVQVPPRAALLVLDQRGTIMARNPANKEWPVGRAAPTFDASLSARGGFEGEVAGNGADDVKRYYTVRRIEGTDGMVVLMKRRSAEVFAASRWHLIVHLVTIGVVFVAMFGLAWLNARKYVGKPLLKLRAGADRVAAGDLKARTRMDYLGDVGGLAESFDAMAMSLERQDEQNRALLQSVRRSERRFREHLEGAQMLALMLDEDGCITFCNDYLLKALGYTKEEIIGRQGLDFVVEEDREQSRQLPDLQLRPIIENRVLTKDGSQRPDPLEQHVSAQRCRRLYRALRARRGCHGAPCAAGAAAAIGQARKPGPSVCRRGA